MVRLFLFALLSLPLLSTAQYDVKGTVLKPDGSPVASIVVQIKNLSAATTVGSVLTDSAGSFAVSVPGPGTYQLKLISLFYRDTTLSMTATSNNKDMLLEPIRLQPLSQIMKTVTVTTKKEMLEFKDDHIAFIPSADPTIGSRPISDILNRIPGILIDAKNQVTAKGQENVQLLINGRIVRTPAGDYLAQLNADEVDRIEVYDNATRFSYIKAAIVMNVILKTKQPKKLWNAAINANTLPKINPAADASFSFGKQRLYARLSHDLSNFRSKGYLTRLTDSFHVHQSFNNRTQHQMSTARLGWDYFMDSATTLTIEGNYSRHTDKLNASINVATPDDQFHNLLSSSPVEKELSGFVAYRVDQKQKGHKMLELGVTRFQLVNERNLPGIQLIEQRRMNNHSLGFKAEWQYNKGKLRILNGVFGQLTRVTDHVDTISLSHALMSNFQNKTITSYHEITWQRKKWNFSLGANADFIHIRLNRSKGTSYNYEQLFLNPAFKINNIHGKSRTAFSYNRKYILPSTHMMFGQYSQYEYGRVMPGNYHLEPALQDLFKLSYSVTKKATVLLELYYDLTRGPAIMLNRLNGTSITHQPENLESRKSIGAVLSINYAPLPYYNFTINIDGRRSEYEFKEKTFVLNPVTWHGSSTIVNRFTVNKKLSLSFNASLHNWQTSLYRNMEKFLTCAIQGSYKVNPKLSMSFSVNDLFNRSRFNYTGMIAEGYYESGFSNNQMRNAFVSIRYQLINSSLEKKTSTLKSFMSE